MSKVDQVLEIDPATELHFKGPFTEVVSSIIKLHNPSNTKVCFKVKTTAPKKYCVRPNSGIVNPEDTVSVSVMLQPHDFDPKEKSKHKFMVQAIVADGDTENLEHIWKEASPEQIMDSKLKCVFDLPEDYTPKGDLTVQSPANKDPASSIESVVSSPGNVTKVLTQEVDKLAEIKSPTQPSNADSKSLKAEILRLKEENERLKGDLRQRTVGIKPNVSSKQEAMATLHTGSESESQFPPIAYLVVALIIGLLLGKMFL